MSKKQLDPVFPVFTVGTDDDDDQYDLVYGDRDVTDIYGRVYRHVGRFLEDEDFYQGLNMITVIENEAGNKFGFSWWEDISKHGEAYIVSNGDEYGLECDTDVPDFNWDTDYVHYYVFVPVEEYPITAYRPVSNG